jgi:hypothetical protein
MWVLNKPVSEEAARWGVYFEMIGTFWLNREEVAEYNKDPDEYVVRRFGFRSREQYAEFVFANDKPRCGATTNAGRPCCNSPLETSFSPKEWIAGYRPWCQVHDPH